MHVEAGLDFAPEVPRMNVLGVRLHLLHRRDVRQLLVADDRRVLAGRVGQHHRVVAVGVPEVVADALLLHQAADEVEVGLPVLHAVGPLAVRRGQLDLEVREPVIRKHRLDDVRNLHVLKDPAVGGAGQEPEPRADGRDVAVVAAVRPACREARHVAVEISRLVVGQAKGDVDVLAEDVVELDVLLAAQEIELVLERPAHLLARAHAMEQQYVLAERRDDFHHSRHDIPLSRRKAAPGWPSTSRAHRGSLRHGRAHCTPTACAPPHYPPAAAAFRARTTRPCTGTPDSRRSSAWPMSTAKPQSPSTRST